MTCRKIKVSELCNIERAVSGKRYKQGSCYIKLSAVDEFVGQLEADGTIDTRYAVFEPVKRLNTAYFFIAIERCFPEFLRRYRTTINLQFDTLKHFVIDWHDDEEAQAYVVKSIGRVEDEIRLIEQQIAYEKEMKRWYLAKMMV